MFSLQTFNIFFYGTLQICFILDSDYDNKKEHKKLIKFCKTNDINIYWHVNDFKMLYLR